MKNFHKEFIKKNLYELLSIGIPLETLEKKDGWTYFLEHGYCYYTQWDSNNLNKKEIQRLLDFIAEYTETQSFSNILESDLLRRLANSED